jgi:hypothetical protein
MAASDSLRVLPLQVRTLAFGGISASYAAVGAPSTDSCRMLLVQNLTDQTLMFSHDGTTDHYPLAAGSMFILDVTTNKTSTVSGFYISTGTTIYCKQLSGAPGSGGVYVTFWCGENR